MYRHIYLMAVALSLAGGLAACENRRDDPRGEAGMRSEADTVSEAGTRSEADTGSETGKLSEADKKAGRTLEKPGDSVRLEDTLSIPPASSDTTKGQ
jgi:hypothetical protein